MLSLFEATLNDDDDVERAGIATERVWPVTARLRRR
jgi:hypothetical protein